MKQTRDEMMTHGRISTLSPTRDNIHCFGAVKETARGIDINTLHGENTFSFLNMSEKPVDADNQIFEATLNPELGQSSKKG